MSNYANDEYRTRIRFWMLLFERGSCYECSCLEPIVDAIAHLDHESTWHKLLVCRNCLKTFGFSQERTIYRHLNIYNECSNSQDEAVQHILRKIAEFLSSLNALSRVCWRNQILKRTITWIARSLTFFRRRFGDSLGKDEKSKRFYSLQRLIHSQTLRLKRLHQTTKQGWSLLESCIRKMKLTSLRLSVIKQTQMVIIPQR